MGGTKGQGGGGSGQDPVRIMVSRKYAQTLYKILPGLKILPGPANFPPGLFQAVALALGLPGSLPKKKKGGGKKYP
jgi:hypothetical protein